MPKFVNGRIKESADGLKRRQDKSEDQKIREAKKRVAEEQARLHRERRAGIK